MCPGAQYDEPPSTRVADMRTESASATAESVMLCSCNVSINESANPEMKEESTCGAQAFQELGREPRVQNVVINEQNRPAECRAGAATQARRIEVASTFWYACRLEATYRSHEIKETPVVCTCSHLIHPDQVACSYNKISREERVMSVVAATAGARAAPSPKGTHETAAYIHSGQFV